MKMVELKIKIEKKELSRMIGILAQHSANLAFIGEKYSVAKKDSRLVYQLCLEIEDAKSKLGL